MKITYTNTTDDIDIYARLLYAKSPTVKQHRQRSTNFAISLIVIIAVIIYFIESPYVVFYWLVISLVWILYIPIQHRRKYVKNMIKQYRDEDHRHFFTTHNLELTDDGLKDSIDFGISFSSWDKIEHIEILDSHAFVFIEHAMAYAIPKERVSGDNYDNFISQIKERIKNENRSPE